LTGGRIDPVERRDKPGAEGRVAAERAQTSFVPGEHRAVGIKQGGSILSVRVGVELHHGGRRRGGGGPSAGFALGVVAPARLPVWGQPRVGLDNSAIGQQGKETIDGELVGGAGGAEHEQHREERAAIAAGIRVPVRQDVDRQEEQAELRDQEAPPAEIVVADYRRAQEGAGHRAGRDHQPGGCFGARERAAGGAVLLPPNQRGGQKEAQFQEVI